MGKQKKYCGFTNGELMRLAKQEYVPNPRTGEDGDAFISRCMANGEMTDSFPDSDQRMAVCNTALEGMARHDDDDKKKRKKKGTPGYQAEEGFERDVEIFAVGVWNGMDFTREDLMVIANSFHQLGDNHDVPLKLGHNEEQPFTDGQPALGWVSDVWVIGDKLMAHFVNIPEIVHNAMEAELYKHVSIELDMGVEHKGEFFPLVLSGVALLGSDIPAVNTLEDLNELMGRPVKANLSSESRSFFTAKGDDDMTNEIEKLKAELAAKDEALKDAVGKNVGLETQVTTFAAKDKVREDTDKVAKFAKHKADLTADLDQLVKDKKITPAKREKFLAEFADDDEVIARMKYVVDAFKDAATISLKEGEDAGGKKGEGEPGDDPNDEIHLKVMQSQADNPTLTFDACRTLVFKSNPKLARAYIDSNGVKEA